MSPGRPPPASGAPGVSRDRRGGRRTRSGSGHGGEVRADIVHRRRLAAQLLSGEPAPDPVAVAEQLLAVQAQDLRAARLAVRARTKGLTAQDVDRCLTVDRSLVVTWLNRGTLHLVRSEDYAWLHAVTTPQLRTSNARRLAQEGVSQHQAEHGVKVIQRALADGPLTRASARERLDAAGVPTAGQALVHVLMLTCLQGDAVRGPVVGGEQAYVAVPDWLGHQPSVDRDTALAELGRRYLAGHGPAADRDLAKWAGVTLGDARRALLSAPQPQTTVVPELPPPRLLGPWEPLLLGWSSREDVLAGQTGLVTVNGVFKPFALVEGRAVATWRLTSGRAMVETFVPLADKVVAALEEDGEDVVRFLGG